MACAMYRPPWRCARVWAHLRADMCSTCNHVWHVNAYDAAYVALAEALRAPLLTADRRHAEAPGIRASG
jgi:predicted nucleic acid-binding protein